MKRLKTCGLILLVVFSVMMFSHSLLSLFNVNKNKKAEAGTTYDNSKTAEVNTPAAEAATATYNGLIRVLEIQPYNGAQGDIPNRLNKMFGVSTDKVQVTTMSSWQYIGDISDILSEYDMIYVGGIGYGNNSTLATIQGNGVLYTHTGNATTVPSGSNRLGLFSKNGVKDNITSFQFSGNDITVVKLKELLAFAKAGYPIMFSGDLYEGTTNTSKLGVCNVRLLMQSMLSDSNYSGSYFRDWSDNMTAWKTKNADKNRFLTRLKTRSFSVKLVKCPVTYHDRTVSAYANLRDDEIYINGAANGSDDNIENIDAEYTIKITGNVTGYLKVTLLLDTNSDGKFDESTEKLDGLEILEGSRVVRYDRLECGKTYTITRAMMDYLGGISWKLTVSSVNNSGICTSFEGIMAVKKSSASPKEKLRILQIQTNDSNGSNNKTVSFATRDEINAAIASNQGKDLLEKIAEKPNEKASIIKNYFKNQGVSLYGVKNETNRVNNTGMFYYYTSILTEFEIEFYRINASDFERLVASPGVVNTSAHLVVEKGRVYCIAEDGSKAEADMLILGYSDMYAEINADSAIKLIKDFIARGGAVLFTHDTTSFMLDESIGGSWSTKFTKAFRQLLGMDRYDAMINLGDGALLQSAKDKPTDGNGNVIVSNGKALVQGFTNAVILPTIDQNGNKTYPNYLTTTVTQANHGQLTDYPYDIPENLSVSQTHAQYFQLDFESDDIVVWYCLSSASNLYSIKNDVRNSYYIYNKGNITYSGVGHTGNLTDDEAKLFVNTMIAAYNAGTKATSPVISNKDKSTGKDGTEYIYVDYEVGAELNAAGQVVVDEAANPMNKGNDLVVKREVVNGTEVTSYYKRVFFSFRNQSIVENKTLSVHYYVEKQDGTLIDLPLHLSTVAYEVDDEGNPLLDRNGNPVGNPASEVSFNYTDFDTDDQVSATGYLVESGQTYYVDIPISNAYYKAASSGSLTDTGLNTNTTIKVCMRIIMRYGQDPSQNIPVMGDTNVVFIKRGIFDLD